MAVDGMEADTEDTADTVVGTVAGADMEVAGMADMAGVAAGMAAEASVAMAEADIMAVMAAAMVMVSVIKRLHIKNTPGLRRCFLR